MRITIFLFVLIVLNSLCFGQASQTGTQRIMIYGQWVDSPVLTIKGGTPTYYDAHPKEKAMDDAIQENRPRMDMYQKSIEDIRRTSPPPSDEKYRKKTYSLTPPPPPHRDDDPTPSPMESVPLFHGKPGTTYTTIGNTTLGSDGSTSTRIGNSNLNSDLTTDTQFGNTLFKSNGPTANRIGNTTFGSDGTRCTKIGNQTFCN